MRQRASSALVLCGLHRNEICNFAANAYKMELCTRTTRADTLSANDYHSEQ